MGTRSESQKSTQLDHADRWRWLVDSLDATALFLIDASGHVRTWNPGAQALLGYTEQEILGRSRSVFYTPEDLAQGQPANELALAKNAGRLEFEATRVSKDAARFRARVVITAQWDEARVLRGFAISMSEVRAAHRSEDEVGHSEERFRLLVDAVEDYAIFILDPSGRVASWNRGAEKIKGYTADEIIGSHLSRFYPPEDLASNKPERELETALRVGKVEDEGFRVRKDGSLFWANVVITALRDERGELRGFAKVTRDLSGRRSAEEELRRSEERFRLLVDSVSDYAIYMLDQGGNVTTWNRGAQKLKQYDAEEIVGKNFSRFFPEEDVRAGKPEQELARALAEGRFEEEAFRLRKDGTKFWANVVLTPMRDSKGELLGFAKITRDLSERMLAENMARELVREQAARAAAEEAEARVREAARAAEEAAQRAEEANRVKDEFLATVSHELRTPLNAIVGWSSLLRARNTDAGLAKGLEVVHRNALAQGKIIEDILDVSRIITGKLQLDEKPTDVVSIVHDALEVVRPSAIAKQLTLEFRPPNEDCRLIADADRLRQVAWNLLSNAVKFSDPGGHVEVSLHAADGQIVLTVSDTGRGIEPAFLPFVFDRFVQADSSATRRVGGLGLGLAIVRHLVELHGGDVQALSNGLGHGATFRVRLPRRAIAQAFEERETGSLSEQRSVPPSGHPAGSLAGRRVLVVDDEEDARELLFTVLSEAGAVVEIAASADQGYAAITRFRPGVLISDIGMPGEDGYAFIERVKALDPASGGGIPAIALTAYTRSNDVSKALSMGFTTHMPKPVHPDDLIAMVKNLAAFVRR